MSLPRISRSDTESVAPANDNVGGEVDSGGSAIGNAASHEVVAGHEISSDQAIPNATVARNGVEIIPRMDGPGEGIHIDTDMIGCWSLTKRSSNPIREGFVISSRPWSRQ